MEQVIVRGVDEHVDFSLELKGFIERVIIPILLDRVRAKMAEKVEDLEDFQEPIAA